MQFCQLPNCNLFTQHLVLLLGEIPLLKPWTPVHLSSLLPSLLLLLFLLFLLLGYYFVVLVIGEVLKATPVNTPSLINILSCAFSGVVELTTQLLRLISILWLPLCRINKLGYSYPRRLLRSPTLVGYQDYFLAPLPGSIALLISSLDKYTSAYYSGWY